MNGPLAGLRVVELAIAIQGRAAGLHFANMGAEVIDRSEMGDELNFVPTDKETLRSLEKENIFVIGDATDLPASKAGSVATAARLSTA